jgi:hypothetical protein
MWSVTIRPVWLQSEPITSEIPRRTAEADALYAALKSMIAYGVLLSFLNSVIASLALVDWMRSSKVSVLCPRLLRR